MKKRFAACLLAVAGCLLGQQQRQPNVVVLLADQLRADRLHCYGNPRSTSPNIDSFAAQGVLFQRYYANAPWTCPSQATLATSFYPSRHGKTQIAFNQVVPFPSDAVMLAQLFHNGGYGTAAFSNNTVAGSYLLGQGFDLFDAHDGSQLGADTQPGAVNQRILSWIDQNSSKPFFIYVNYFQPHYPYVPPPEHDIFKNDVYPNETAAGYATNNQDLFRWTGTGNALAIERITQLYDGYVHYLDDGIGQLVQALKDRGLADNTIFVITSDHGELLYSHPKDWLTSDHRSLYDAVLHVPAIMWGPGIPQGRVVPGMASHVDTAPTLLDLAGLPSNPAAEGSSLLQAISGGVDHPDANIFSESDLEVQERSVRDERYKLILNVETGAYQLFDTTLDPNEQTDVSADLPDVVTGLSALLDQWRSQNEPSADVLHSRWAALATTTESIDDGAPTVHLSGGGWSTINQPATMAAMRYWTAPQEAAEPVRSITWRTNNQKVGRYTISIKNGTPTGVTVATNSPFTVVTRTGSYTVNIDQTKGNAIWQVIGTYTDPLSVTLTNQANGYIVAGVIKFDLVQ